MRTRRMEHVQVTDLVASDRAISFGPFHLVPTQRLLLEDDNPVRVGSRALDIFGCSAGVPWGAGRERRADGPGGGAPLWRREISNSRSAPCGGRWAMDAAAGGTPRRLRALLTFIFLPALYVTWFRIDRPQSESQPDPRIVPFAAGGRRRRASGRSRLVSRAGACRFRAAVQTVRGSNFAEATCTSIRPS